MTIGITLTGADERTPIPELQRLVKEYPSLEIGMLYTAKPEGRNRYPSWDWLVDTSAALAGRCALHVCGRIARIELIQGQLCGVTQYASRIQINGLLDNGELHEACETFRRHVVITQDKADNRYLRLTRNVNNHALLVDGSGGRGIAPSEWVRPNTWKDIGFAGGMGPDNLAEELPKIAAVATGNWWIDMENNLRTDDWFDLDKARKCLEIQKTMGLK